MPGLDAPGSLHHVMDQGINGIKMFRNRCGCVACFSDVNTSAVNRLPVSYELPGHSPFIRKINSPIPFNLKSFRSL